MGAARGGFVGVRELGAMVWVGLGWSVVSGQQHHPRQPGIMHMADSTCTCSLEWCRHMGRTTAEVLVLLGSDYRACV